MTSTLPLLLCALVPSADTPLHQQIDVHLASAWKAGKITPAPLAADAIFLRRLYLDLVGTIPTAAETKAFLADKDAKKRDKLITRLLADPRFASQQADVWDQAIFGRNPPNPEATRKRPGFKAWLTKQFTENTPYDRWTRELLQAKTADTALFYVQFRGNPEETAVGVSRLFLGTQLQCARCHDHPREGWTQKDFYGLAAFFARLVAVSGPVKNGVRQYTLGEKNSGEVLFTGPAVKLKPGQKGTPIKPRFLGGKELDEPALPAGYKEPKPQTGKPLPPPKFSRKDKIAAWIASGENPTFARAVANRVWGQFLGRGIVHPVDDLSTKRIPKHAKLLDLLTRELVAHKFDLKWYIGQLVRTRAYQLAGTGPATEELPYNYERARVRPLSAEELLASLRVATGYPEKAQLPSGMGEYFFRTFGDPAGGTGEFQGGLREHLFLGNSPHLRQMIVRRKGNLADTLLLSTGDRVEPLFLAVLNRQPSAKEKQRFLEHLGGKGKPEQLIEEAIWALLVSSEFRFNH